MTGGQDRLAGARTLQLGVQPFSRPPDSSSARGRICFSLAIGLLLANALSALAQTGTRNWRPEERVVLRDYGDVYQVATTNAAVFAVTRGGVIAYDSRFDHWMPPITELDGLPRSDTRAVAAIGDPADESLWFGTRDAVVHYVPMVRLFDRIAVPGGVSQLMFDRLDPFRGLYVRTSNEWMLVQRGSGVAVRAFDLPPAERRATSTTVEDVLQRYPAADAMQAFAVVADGRRYRYTSASVDPMNRNAFFGTNGLGLLRYDGGVARLESLPFGLVTDGVGAVALADGGVWVGSTPSRQPAEPYTPGFTWVSGDFQQTRMERGPGMAGVGGGFRFGAVRDIARWEGSMWAATDAGLVRFEGGRIRVIDRSDGLPANDLYALAATPGILWVGTARGLASVRDGGDTVQWVDVSIGRGVAARSAITALGIDGASLWLGGRWGVSVLAVGASGVERIADLDPSVIDEPVVDMAVGGGHSVISSREDIVWRGRDGEWNVARPLGGLGDITALAADRSGVWLGGRLGVQFFLFESRGFTVAAGPGDLPGEVRDIAVSERYIWVGTDGGLVRLERDAVVP